MRLASTSILFLFLLTTLLRADEKSVRLTLKEAITLAQLQSVDAAVVLNELKTAYWEYRTHKAEQ